MSNTQKKNKKTTRFLSTTLLAVASIALITLSIIAATKASAFAHTITVDPALGYAPNSYVQNPHLISWFLGTPVLWVIPLLVAIIIAVSRYRDGYAILTCTFIASAILLFVGAVETSDRTHDTFSTWAQQRYGIEIERPPYEERGFLEENKSIDTEAKVMLDDGQVIGFEEYKDSRGDRAYIIVDRSSPDSGELPRLR